VPVVLSSAQINLSAGEAEQEFALVALANLEGREVCLAATASAVADHADASTAQREELAAAGSRADEAVAHFREWGLSTFLICFQGKLVPRGLCGTLALWN
jgi:hypothetical protein